MTLETKINDLKKELACVTAAIAALEYFANPKSPDIAKGSRKPNSGAYLETLKRHRSACAAAIAECERLAKAGREAGSEDAAECAVAPAQPQS